MSDKYKVWERGSRVKLTGDYVYCGFKYSKGQEGSVIADFYDSVAVDFDGYEKERKEAEELRSKNEEGPNITVYQAEIRKEFLI